MGIEALGDFLGEWELEVGLPGTEDTRRRVVFEALGDVIVQRTFVPIPEAADTVCIIVGGSDARYVQHYFDSRGVVRLYEMIFDGSTWTLERTKADFSPLDLCPRYVGTFSDRETIDSEWQTSDDGREWQRDFQLTYRRMREPSSQDKVSTSATDAM
jgi:hypothetical protein